MSRLSIIIILSRLIFVLSTFLVATTATKGSTHDRNRNFPRRLGKGISHRFSCPNWRLSVETNNDVVAWKTVPRQCEAYVANYMLGNEYRKEFKYVTNEAILYAKRLDISKDDKNVWIFDLDETTLSNLPYFAKHRFGAEPFNSTAFDEWILTGKASGLVEALKLYKVLLSLKIKVVFLTARTEDKRTISGTNLKRVGFHTWEKFVLKGSKYAGKTIVEYKSAERKKLESDGYRIVGNIGDQWSDILGTNTGYRTFKLPNPMYYIS